MSACTATVDLQSTIKKRPPSRRQWFTFEVFASEAVVCRARGESVRRTAGRAARPGMHEIVPYGHSTSLRSDICCRLDLLTMSVIVADHGLS